MATGSASSKKHPRPESVAGPKIINVALQGGGAHGAYAWGVLDRLLEDRRIDLEGISATSAGALNAVVLAHGLRAGGRDGARAALRAFWQDVADTARYCSPYQPLPWDDWLGRFDLDNSPAFMMMDMATRLFSPYQINPCNLNPLRTLLERHVDFAALRDASPIKLFICATNVETGKIRLFQCDEISPEAVLASACLPHLFQAVEIDGEFFWDGGYVGNPAIFPLIYNCTSPDVLIVHINPIVRRGCPRSAAEILNRLNEVSFNSSLMREMRAIAFVTSLIERGVISPDEMKAMRIHSVRADDVMAEFGVSSKLNTSWKFLCHLFASGRTHADAWLKENFDAVGVRSSVDLRAEFL